MAQPKVQKVTNDDGSPKVPVDTAPLVPTAFPRVSFWRTTAGILIKRLVFNAVAQVALVLYNDLVAGSVDWSKVKYALAVQVAYIILTFSRDLADEKIPNTTNG